MSQEDNAGSYPQLCTLNLEDLRVFGQRQHNSLTPQERIANDIV